MADVKWIKLTTDMFDNRKIKHLRRLPDGNNIVLLWIMLLTMAGRCNAGGMIFLTENIPYTPKMLADELDFEENTVILGIQALENLSMVCTQNGCYSIAGWEEYQNIDGLNIIREQTRQRVAKHRENKRLQECNVTSNGDVTLRNAIDKDIEVEVDKDIEVRINNKSTPTATKHKHGTHNNVLLTDDEYLKLQERYPADYEEKINTLSEGIALKGYKYKSHYLAVIRWAENDKAKNQSNNVPQQTDYDKFMDGLNKFVKGE